jgi:hypothetical protein
MKSASNKNADESREMRQRERERERETAESRATKRRGSQIVGFYYLFLNTRSESTVDPHSIIVKAIRTSRASEERRVVAYNYVLFGKWGFKLRWLAERVQEYGLLDWWFVWYFLAK